jgi:methyl-accepting chemotaxis protein
MAGNLTIRKKLLGFSLLGVGFVLLVGAVGLVATRHLSNASQEMAINTNALKVQMQADMMHDALRGDALRALLAGQRGDHAEEPSIRADLKEHAQVFNDALKELSELSHDEAITAKTRDIKPSLDAYLAAASEVVDLGLTHPEQASAKLGSFQKAFATLEDEMEQINQLLNTRAQAVDEANHKATRMATTVILSTALLAAVVCLVVGHQMGRGILLPIAQATQVATTVAAGDLTSRIEVGSQDEVGQLLSALKTMNDRLADLVGDVRSSGDHIATGSSQIAMGNADLSHRTEQQASSLQETAASMEQLTSTVRHNADTAQQATQLATSASTVAARGGEIVGQVVHTMDEISASSRKIADIIGVIDGIAFQTNILALNAAVEAARAGEQGRGFAVVAGEVRSLAQRSAEAAKEIKSLIGDSVEKVEAGSRLVGNAGSTMTDIVTQVRMVCELINEISASTHDQSDGIGQVNQAVNQLDQVTQQNAALVEESAAAAESLKQQAGRLVASVSVFKLEPA